MRVVGRLGEVGCWEPNALLRIELCMWGRSMCGAVCDVCG